MDDFEFDVINVHSEIGEIDVSKLKNVCGFFKGQSPI